MRGKRYKKRYKKRYRRIPAVVMVIVILLSNFINPVQILAELNNETPLEEPMETLESDGSELELDSELSTEDFGLDFNELESTLETSVEEQLEDFESESSESESNPELAEEEKTEDIELDVHEEEQTPEMSLEDESEELETDFHETETDLEMQVEEESVDFVLDSLAATVPGKISDIFTDENLAKLIASNLNKGVDDTVTANDLSKVTELNGDNQEIRKLDGMQTLENLVGLSLKNNEIRDISPLKALIDAKKLKHLCLDYNQINDFSLMKNYPTGDYSATGQKIFEVMEDNQIAFEIIDRNGNNLLNSINLPEGVIYKDGYLIVGDSASNEIRISWSTKAGGGVFSGELIIIGKTHHPTLELLSVPDIEFIGIPIQSEEKTFNRTGATEEKRLSVIDTRGEGNTWRIQASIDSPLTSEEGHKLPENALIFIDSIDGNKREQTLNAGADAIVIYNGVTNADPITTVFWQENEGILLRLRPIVAKANTEYTTTITWTLVDGPL